MLTPPLALDCHAGLVPCPVPHADNSVSTLGTGHKIFLVALQRCPSCQGGAIRAACLKKLTTGYSCMHRLHCRTGCMMEHHVTLWSMAVDIYHKALGMLL